MSIFTIGFLAGIFIIFNLAVLPSIFLLTSFLTIIAIIFVYKRNVIIFFAFSLALGLSYATIYGTYLSTAFISHQLENKNLTITGFISSLPKNKTYYQSFLFTTTQLSGKKSTIQLSWNNKEAKLIPGQIWRLTVKLKRPHTLANPGSFDAERFAFEQGISAKGYVVHSKQNKFLGINHLSTPLNFIREHLRQKIFKCLPNIPSAIFIPAFTIGDQESLKQNDWNILQATGTNHLVAIAGLHVGLLCSLIFFITRLVWRHFPYLILAIPVNCAAALASIIVAILYCALAGFSLPTQRALIMLSTFMLGIFLRRHLPAWHSYWLAMFLVLLIAPYSVLSASFWLSFTAVASIIWMLSYKRRRLSSWHQHLKLQIAVSLGVLPCTIFFFHNASLISPIANTIVVPWVGLIVVPLSLLGTLFSLFSLHLAHYILYGAAYCMQIAWWLLQWLSHFSYSTISMVFSRIIFLIFSACTIFLLLCPRHFSIRYLAGFFMLPIFFQAHAIIPNDSIKLTVLEVGQGLSCIIQTKNHALLYDAGPAQADGTDTGRDIIYPFMQYEQLLFFNTMIISHGDNDHSGGAFYLLDHHLAGQIYTSSPQLFQKYSIPINECKEPHQWDWDGVEFTLFTNQTAYRKDNNASCVLKVSINHHAVLLPGDIENIREKQLIKQDPTLLSADILLAPHHGSLTSSLPTFTHMVHPYFVIFSTGYLNRFHFPNQQVLDRYQAIHATNLNTPETGMIQIQLSKNGTILVFFERNLLYEWWHKV